MSRTIQPKGTKGSLKWVQHVVNEWPNALNDPINDFIGNKQEQTIEWLSPKVDDDYAEYRDQAFLDLFGITLSKIQLKDFWPVRGPQWDALGKIGNKAYLLIEAKAHVTEIISSSQAKSPKSITSVSLSGKIFSRKYLSGNWIFSSFISLPEITLNDEDFLFVGIYGSTNV